MWEMGAAPSAGGLRDLVTSGVGFWVRGRSLSFYLGLLKAQNHFSAPNQMVHKVAQSPRAEPKMHVKTDLNNPLRAPCNRVYFHKKLTGLGSKSHCREPPPRSGEKPPDPCRLLRSSTTPPLWPCHPRGERQGGALGVLARWLRSLQMIPGLKY